MTDNRRMVTSDQLAKVLQAVNVEDVAKLAGVSTKTVYRLRHKKHSTTIDTAADLVSAARKLNPEGVRAVLGEAA